MSAPVPLPPSTALRRVSLCLLRRWFQGFDKKCLQFAHINKLPQPRMPRAFVVGTRMLSRKCLLYGASDTEARWPPWPCLLHFAGVEGIRRSAYGLHTACNVQHLHTAFAHSIRTQHLHTAFAHSICTQHLHTAFAHSICTQHLHTEFAHSILHAAFAHSICTQHFVRSISRAFAHSILHAAFAHSICTQHFVCSILRAFARSILRAAFVHSICTQQFARSILRAFAHSILRAASMSHSLCLHLWCISSKLAARVYRNVQAQYNQYLGSRSSRLTTTYTAHMCTVMENLQTLVH